MTVPNQNPTVDKAVDIVTDQGVIDAHLFHPEEAGSWPGVLLLTDIRGVRPAFQAMGRRLAANGYVVLLPNIYYRAGRAPVVDPTLPINDEVARARRSELRATLTPDVVRTDLAAQLDYLASQQHVRGDRAGVVGYCLTGAFALRAAEDFPDRIAAAASFHGGGLASDAPDSPHLRVDQVGARLYLGYADEDPSMPPEMIERLETALRKAGVPFRSELYTGARHGFAVEDGQAFDRDAAERHWRNLIDLFDSAFVTTA
jgi:carboxymethylenebutenolidase